MSAPAILAPAAQQRGSRLDVFLANELAGVSRVRARDLILSGNARVDGKTVRPSFRIEAGQRISVELPDAAPSDLTPEPMDIRIVYEDDDVAVIDKPSGLVVHPAPGHGEHTLVHGLLACLQDLGGIGGSIRPGIVHRLDRDTSGLLVVAKTDRAHMNLAAQFASRTVKKGYLALISGSPSAARAVIDAPIGRDPGHRQRMAVTARGRSAATRYSILTASDRWTFVLAMPLTGRTHQIRVHFASIGCPLAGDQLYGGSTAIVSRQFLHAAFLRFARPSDGRSIELESPLPPDLGRPLQRLLTSGARTRASLSGMDKLIELARKQFHTEEFAPAGKDVVSGVAGSV